VTSLRNLTMSTRYPDSSIVAFMAG
jgi:hypothetical protein